MEKNNPMHLWFESAIFSRMLANNAVNLPGYFTKEFDDLCLWTLTQPFEATVSVIVTIQLDNFIIKKKFPMKWVLFSFTNVTKPLLSGNLYVQVS